MVRVDTEGEYVRRPASFDTLSSKAKPLLSGWPEHVFSSSEKNRMWRWLRWRTRRCCASGPCCEAGSMKSANSSLARINSNRDLLDWIKTPGHQKTEALLSGLKLTRARTWLAAKPLQLSAAEREFIQASITQYDQELSRRERVRRRVRQATGFAFLALIALLGMSIRAWRSSNRLVATAESARLATQSQEDLYFGNLGLAFQEAVQAMERSPSEPAEYALRQVLTGPIEMQFCITTVR